MAAGLVALASGLGLVGGPVGTAQAVNYYISRFDDPLPDGCFPNDCSLREALLNANITAGGDVLNLPAGTYTLTLAGAGEDAGATGDLDILDDLTIAVQGGTATLDATGLGDRVFHVIGASSLPAVSMSALTLTGGLADTGGGLHNAGGSVTLTDILVSGNSASGPLGNGGGLYNGGGTMSLTRCTITGNSAAALTAGDNGGGAIYNDGTLTLADCTLSGNTAEGELGQGGALYNAAGSATVTGSILSGNLSSRDPANFRADGGGGAIYNGPLGTLSLDGGSLVSDNTASGSYGGGIYNGGTLTAANSTLSGNACDAAGCGGAVYNAAGQATLTASTVSANSGGGLSNQDGGTMILDTVTVSENVNTITSGGGLFNSESTMDVSDSLITDNTAPSGGGLFNTGGTVTLTDSAVSDNIADSYTVHSKGGGIWNYAQTADAHLTLIGTTVSGNATLDSLNQGDDGGGGIYNGSSGSSGYVATLVLIESAVSTNTATQGAGIYNDWSRVELVESTIDHNTSLDSGGGIYSYRGVLMLNDSTVDGNISGMYGGGLYNVDGLEALDLTIYGSTFSNNTAAFYGGGLYNRDITSIIEDSLFSGNAASDGGGLYVVYEPTTMSNSTVSGNSATDAGGGFNLQAGSTLTLEASTVSGNSSLDDGGGLYLFNSTASVIASTLSGNSASNDGGGLWAGGNSYGDSTASLVNSTVSGNSAYDGAGLYILDTLHLSHSTVSDNSASTNGAAVHIFSIGEMTAFASVVASQAAGADCDTHSNVYSEGYNLESGYTCQFSAVGDLQNTDPLLLPLADNGGLTQTHALSDGSPAIDAGDPADCQADLDGDGIRETLLAADQRGQAREDVPGVGNESPDQVCDIGAYEYVPLVVNGGFEADLDGNGVPDGWLRGFGPQDVQDCALLAHSGICTFRLSTSGTKLRMLRQTVQRAGLAGDSYTLSVWSRAVSASATILAAQMQFNYSDGTSSQHLVPLGGGTHRWMEYQAAAAALRDYDSITVSFITIMKSGLVLVDDVTLVQN